MNNNQIVFNDKKAAFINYEKLALASVDNRAYEFFGASQTIVNIINTKKRISFKELIDEINNEFDIRFEHIEELSKNFLLKLHQLQIVTGSYFKDCPPNLEYHAVHKELQDSIQSEGSHWEYAKENYIPMRCKLNITWRCNQKCAFCYNGDRENPENSPLLSSKVKELSIDELDDYLGQLRHSGTFFMSLIGGEPLARRDIHQILELTDKYQFAIEIVTNGTLLTEKTVEMLRKHNIQMVFVPLFGSSPEVHNQFVKLEDAFNKAINGIKMLRAAGIRVGVRSFIQKPNFHEWKQVRDLIYSLDADYFPSVKVHKSCDGKVDERKLRISDEQLQELKRDGLTFYNGHECLVGLARVDILPDGSVAPCPLIVTPYGNLRTSKFSDIWQNSAHVKRMRKLVQMRMQSDDYKLEKASRCAHDAIWDDGGITKLSSEAARLVKAFRDDLTEFKAKA